MKKLIFLLILFLSSCSSLKTANLNNNNLINDNLNTSLNTENKKCINEFLLPCSSNNKSENSENVTGGGRTDDLFGSSQDLTKSTFDDDNESDGRRKENLIEYINKIGWDFRFAHSLTYLNNRKQRKIGNNSLMFSGNIILSK